MTLVAGFHCWGGLVLCADTQETRGTFKSAVPKLVVRPQGAVQWEGAAAIFAGAGSAAFIDKLIDEMWKSAEASGPPHLDAWTNAMSEAALAVHEKYWKVYAAGQQPDTEIIFGLSTPEGVRLLKSFGPIVNPVPRFEVSGASYELGPYIAERMYGGATPASTYMETADAVILALYLLQQTKAYVEGVGGQSHVAVLYPNGQHKFLSYEEVGAASRHLGSIDAAITELLIALPNMEKSDDDFGRATTVFMNKLQRFRRNHKEFLAEWERLVKPTVKVIKQ